MCIEDETDDERIKSLFSEQQLAEMQAYFAPAIRKILSKGIHLLSSGINDYALTYEQALAALDQLLHIGTGVVGVDVMERGTDSRISYPDYHEGSTYNAWSPESGPIREKNRYESNYSFAKRTIPQARDFVNDFFLEDDSHAHRYWVMISVA